MINKKVLLISFKFPPYVGVGAFRWANLSYQLAEKGYDVHVITTFWKKEDSSSFLNVLDHPKIFIHKIPSLGFHKLKYLTSNNKLINFFIRSFKYFLRSIFKPFYYLDEAQQWHTFLIPYVKRVLKNEGIKVMIATGAPFSVNYSAARIKRDLGNNVRLIQDFRDPWNDLILYTSTFGTEKRKLRSREMELFSMQNSDCIVTVTKGIVRMFKDNGVTTNMKVIYNGFSIDSNLDVSRKQKKEKKVSVIYAGGFAQKRDFIMFKFLEMIKEAKLEKYFKIDIFSQNSLAIKEFLKANDIKCEVNIKDYISYYNLMEIISNYDFGLHLNSEYSVDALSTKIFDYLSNNVPVLSINWGDEIHSFINDNKFGYSISLKSINGIEVLSSICKNKEYQIDENNLKKFNYKNLCDEYISLIESL